MFPHQAQAHGSSHGHDRNRGHHAHSHGHKHGHKKREREVAKSQSSPALGQVMFESAPLPHVRVSTSTSLDSMGRHEQPKVHIDFATAVESPISESQEKMGAFILGGTEPVRSDKGNKQPVRPLWRKGWKATSITCAVPKLHQPSASGQRVKSEGETTASVSSTLDFPKDRHGANLVLHCIDLQSHNNRLRKLVSAINTKGVENVTQSAPPLPTRFFHPGSASLKKVYTDSSSSVKYQLPAVDLDQTSLYKLLKKSSAAICSYCGYNDTSSQALDTLSSVLGDFLSNFTKQLHTNLDQQCENDGVAFNDVMDQTLHQCGTVGKTALDHYWQDGVKGYVRYLENEVRDNMDKYMQLTEPPNDAPTYKQKGWQESADLDPWPNLDPTPVSEVEEELSLDSIMEHANMDNVLPTKTPDLGGPVSFSQFSDQAIQEEEDNESFSSLGIDGPPPTKRLRTISFGD